MIGREALWLKWNSLLQKTAELIEGTSMELELIEPVVETKEEIVELSLEDLARVGGGVGCVGVL